MQWLLIRLSSCYMTRVLTVNASPLFLSSSSSLSGTQGEDRETYNGAGRKERMEWRRSDPERNGRQWKRNASWISFSLFLSSLSALLVFNLLLNVRSSYRHGLMVLVGRKHHSHHYPTRADLSETQSQDEESQNSPEAFTAWDCELGVCIESASQWLTGTTASLTQMTDADRRMHRFTNSLFSRTTDSLLRELFADVFSDRICISMRDISLNLMCVPHLTRSGPCFFLSPFTQASALSICLPHVHSLHSNQRTFSSHSPLLHVFSVPHLNCSFNMHFPVFTQSSPFFVSY